MTGKDRDIANQLKKKVAGICVLIDFRVFGSRARGDEGQYSDMDVFIEVERLDKQLKNSIRALAWEVGFEHDIHISPLIFSRQEIEDTPLRSAPIIGNIRHNGVLV